MNKLFSLFLILGISMLVSCQQPSSPPFGEDDQMAEFKASHKKDDHYYCNIDFYRGHQVKYQEEMNEDHYEAYRPKLNGGNDNKITSFSWEGEACYCWIVLYQSKSYGGPNVGFLIDSNSGDYDLSYYVAYDHGDWEMWDESVSSYSIYCYL